jgi:hypothetical protein
MRPEHDPGSSAASRKSLGAPPDGYGELGPVSPELALVDPVLADRARMLLPERHEPPSRARPAIESVLPEVSPSRRSTRSPAQRRPRHVRRTVVLAGLIFAAGAASGGMLGRGPDVSTRTPFGGRLEVSTVSASTGLERTAAKAPARRATREPRRPSRTWAANVLGVSVGIGRSGVRLAWERPRRSNHIVVVRQEVARRHGIVVFRGRATSFRDVSARPCTAYWYIIINYDGRGHPSTGVRNSVVTEGCGGDQRS